MNICTEVGPPPSIWSGNWNKLLRGIDVLTKKCHQVLEEKLQRLYTYPVPTCVRHNIMHVLPHWVHWTVSPWGQDWVRVTALSLAPSTIGSTLQVLKNGFSHRSAKSHDQQAGEVMFKLQCLSHPTPQPIFNGQYCSVIPKAWIWWLAKKQHFLDNSKK